MDKSASVPRRPLAVLLLLAISGLVNAASSTDELLRQALNARAAGRTTEAIRLLTELKALTPNDKRLDTLLASLQAAMPPGNAGLSPPPDSPPPGAAISAGETRGKADSPAVFSESPSDSPKAKPDSTPASKSQIPPPPPSPSEPSLARETSKGGPKGSEPNLISNLKSEIPDRTALLQAALQAQADGNPEQALALLQQLQKLAPEDPRVSTVVSALTAGAANPASPSISPKAQPDSTPASSSSSIPNPSSPTQPEIPAPAGPSYGLPESVVLGVVTWVDPANKQAVVRLYGPWKADRLYLLSRDASFDASAILEASPFHNSRAIGVRAIEGMPLLGQEVIAPGPSVLRRIRDILGPRFRGTPPPAEEKKPDPAVPVTTPVTPPTTPGEGTLDPNLRPF